MKASALFLFFLLCISFSSASTSDPKLDFGVRHIILSEGTHNLIKFHFHQGHDSVGPDTSRCISMTDVQSGVELARLDLFKGRRGLLNGQANSNRWKAQTLRTYGTKLVLHDIRPGMFFEFTRNKTLILGATTQASQNAEGLEECFHHVGKIARKCFNFSQIQLPFMAESDGRCHGIALMLLQSSDVPQTGNLQTPDPDAKYSTLSNFRPIQTKPHRKTVDSGVTKARNSRIAFETLLHVVNQRILSLDDTSDASVSNLDILSSSEAKA